jgi:AraC-like DNA-binding protein
MGEFETIARTDCTRQVKDVAAELNLSPRQFERLSLNCFGLSPKLVLRISRFLNMASAMLGLGDPHEEGLAELRFFDQSHRNREFRQFIGMTPQQFLQTPLPLFRASLKARHLRKSTMSHI